MRIIVITWKTIHQYGDLWVQSHHLRYHAFVQRLAYNVPSYDGLEWDQYDTPRSSYVVIDDHGRCAAVCRLVPTLYPYMIEEIFPELLPYAPPKQADIWEASRIAVDAELPTPRREQALKALIVGVQQFGLDHGVTHYLGLMPVPIFRRTLMRHGVRVNIATGQAREIDGTTTATGEIMVDPETVARLMPMLAAVA